jgi:hypothetical protein
MKFWASLTGGFIAAELCLSLAIGVNLPNPASAEHSGKAYITQSGPATLSQDYEKSFGANWDSVRTFQLHSTLDKPLKIYIETHPTHAGLYQSHYRDYVLESLKVWSNALDGRLSFVITTKRKEADITLDWVSHFEDHLVAGITNYSIGHAGIEIKTVGIPDKDIKCNIIHEMGHALGISGHSKNQNDIMVGMRRWRRDSSTYEPRLSKRDVQAIRRLYSVSWQKGEDLYAAKAQSVPSTTTLADITSSNENTVTLQPFEDSALLGKNKKSPKPASAKPH